MIVHWLLVRCAPAAALHASPVTTSRWGPGTTVLKEATPPIMSEPTHTTTALKVNKDAGGKGGVVHELKRNAGMTLLKAERSWAHIARGGKALGYPGRSFLG